MKLTVGEWYVIAMNLPRLAEKNLPGKTSFRVSRLIKKLSPLIQDVEKQRTDLVKKYGEEDKLKELITVLPKNQDKFNKEWETIAREEETIEFQQLTEADLGDIQISAVILNSLDKLFVDPDDEKKEEKAEVKAETEPATK